MSRPDKIIHVEDHVAPELLALLEHESYDDNTQLATYVIETRGRRVVRCIAPRNPRVQIGDSVEDYGDWCYAVQSASSSGGIGHEVRFAQAIRTSI